MRALFCIAILLPTLLSSCEKDLDLFIPDIDQTGLDSGWTATPPVELPVQTSLFLPPKKDTIRFIGIGPFNFPARSGLNLQMRVGQWLDSTNTPSNTSSYFLETHWITRKGDMIRTQLDLAGNNMVMQSNGISFVQLRNSNGSLLRVAPGSLFTYDAAGTNAPSSLFIRNNMIWAISTDSINRVSYNGQTQRWQFQTQQTGWLAAGQSIPTASSNQVFINSTPEYGNSNTLVYVMTDTQNWVRRATGNNTARRFEVNNLPAVNDLRIIGISLRNGNYYWANTLLNAGSASTTNVLLTFAPISFDALLQALDNL